MTALVDSPRRILPGPELRVLPLPGRSFRPLSEQHPLQINLIHLHGSVYWNKLDAAIQVGYDLSSREGLLDGDAMALLQPFSTALNNPASTLADVPGTEFSDEALRTFLANYEQIPIVNPTKWKFHETVCEEHYYQMLRLLGYELEAVRAYHLRVLIF